MIKEKTQVNGFHVGEIALIAPALLLVFLLLAFPVALVFAENTTTYSPNKYYSVTGDKKTRYIYAGDVLVATIDSTGTVLTTSYVHTDHLNSTNVVTNSVGAPIQTIDYYSFGAERLCGGTSCDAKKKYIGEYSDHNTALDYLNARYYNPHSGQFISQDPMFWSPEKYLMDPQQLNSYSYARNNPINYSDPSGEFSTPMGEFNFPSFSTINSYWNSYFGIGVPKTTPQVQIQQIPTPLINRNNVLNSPVGDAPITSLFMSDRSDCLVCSKIHSGTDYAVPINTPVYATAQGKIIESREINGYGNTIIINHGAARARTGNVYTLYGHGNSLEVKINQEVDMGDLIMYSGNTGKSTGPHVHYEVVLNPTYPKDFYKNINIRYGPMDLAKLLFGK